MERLARKIADRLSDELNFEGEKREVIAYGMIAIVQTFFTLFFVLLIGLLAGVPVEALIVSFSVSLLRKYTGGAHINTIEICTIVGIVYSVTVATISRYLLAPILSFYTMLIVIVLAYTVFFYAVYKLAPVDSPNKPIKSEKKIKRMRKGSFITLTVYLMISVLFIILGFNSHLFYNYNMSLLFGITWQIFTLTKLSAHFFYILDQVGAKFPNSGTEVKK